MFILSLESTLSSNVSLFSKWLDPFFQIQIVHRRTSKSQPSTLNSNYIVRQSVCRNEWSKKHKLDKHSTGLCLPQDGTGQDRTADYFCMHGNFQPCGLAHNNYINVCIAGRRAEKQKKTPPPRPSSQRSMKTSPVAKFCIITGQTEVSGTDDVLLLITNVELPS